MERQSGQPAGQRLTETAIELRALVSANNASAVWDLRCEVREKLIDFLQREHPTALPRRRYEAAENAAAKADETRESCAAMTTW